MTRNKNNKGFTLVELIVVLAILAILAAMLVPSLTGYIDKAKEKKEVANARLLLEATQATLSELYALENDKICDAGSNQVHACSVVTPLTNSIKEPDIDARVRRYYMAYDLAREIFDKNPNIYISVLSEQATAIEAIYYSQGNDYMLIWTSQKQTWEHVDYDSARWKAQYTYCSAGNNVPYWNGRTSFDPKSKNS